MEKYTSVKVSTQTLKKLHHMASKLSIETGKRLNLDETIVMIIDIVEKDAERANMASNILEQDRTDFLALLKRKIKSAGPEDYVPYDFEDIA
ncbi:MAG: hypothetical protein Q6373_018870 [Candidatus Sigynarchaeota archaeon]